MSTCDEEVGRGGRKGRAERERGEEREGGEGEGERTREEGSEKVEIESKAGAVCM